MNKERKAKDPRRNNIFAAAFDYLKRTTDIETQQDLADKMGVTKDTVSRIIRAKTDVTEDAITKLQTASGCIFNLQWLRGESETMLAADVCGPSAQVAESNPQSTQLPDFSSMTNAIIAAKDDAIEALKREVSAKDETIKALREQLAVKDAYIESLKLQVADARSTVALLRESNGAKTYSMPAVAAEDNSF